MLLASLFTVVSPVNRAVSSSSDPGQAMIVAWNAACNSSNITITNPNCGGDPAFSVGNIISVEVNVTNAPTFNGYDIHLYYDPNILNATATSFSQTVFPEISTSKVREELTTPGSLRLAAVALGVTSSGNGTLFHVLFRIRGVGVSPLTFAAGTTNPSDLAQSFTRLVLGDTPIDIGTTDGYFRNEPTRDLAVVYDYNANGMYDSTDTIIVGGVPSVGTALKADPLLKYVDQNNSNTWNRGEPLVYDANNDNSFGPGDRALYGLPFVGNATKVDPLILFVDSNNDNVLEGPTRVGPVANFTFTPSNPKSGQVITFDASSSFDPDNAGGMRELPAVIRSYAWDFGDGVGATNVTSTTVTHVFGSLTGSPFFGNFSVRLTVSDYDYFEGMKVERVSVVPSPVHDLRIERLAATPGQPKPGDNVTIVVVVRNDGTFTEQYNLTVSYSPPTPPPLIGQPVTNQSIADHTSSSIFSFTFRTAGLAPAAYEIIASVTIVSPGVTDDNPGNNVQTTLVTLAQGGGGDILVLVVGVVAAAVAIVAVGMLLRRRRKPSERD